VSADDRELRLAKAGWAVLQRLRLLAGGFSLEEVQLAARDATENSHEIAEIIANLVAKSLVMLDAHGARQRYRLLDTTRSYLHAKG
jgi:predicted ATPase